MCERAGYRRRLRQILTMAVATGLLAGCQTLSSGPESPLAGIPPGVGALGAKAGTSGALARPDSAASVSATPPMPLSRPLTRATATRGLNEGLLLPDDEDKSFGSLRADMGLFVQRGMASWYGPGFHGRKTASGERFDMDGMTAAHPSLPLGSWVLVRNLRNDRAVVVRVTDRGPFAKKRVLDLSKAAAKKLGFLRQGATQVEIRKLSRTEVAAIQQADGETPSEPVRGAVDILADGHTGG